MGHDGLQIGVQIRKFVIITTRISYRSVCKHPFLVGILLFLFVLYRSSPFLFSLLVSSSPVLVCTAVLLGILLSFGETNFPLIEEDEKTSSQVAELKTSIVDNTICFERDGTIDREIGYSELSREIVGGSRDEQPLIGSADKVDKFETDGDFAQSSMPVDQNSREIWIGKQSSLEVNREIENLEIERKASVDDQELQVGGEVGLSHDEILEYGLSGMSQAENFEEYKSAEESVDTYVRDQSDSSAGALEQPTSILEDSLSPVQKADAGSCHDEVLENSELPKVRALNFEEYKSAEGSTGAQIRDRLDSLRSWEQPDCVLEDRVSPGRKVQAAVLAQLRNQLESSLGSWNRFDMAVENRSSAAQKAQAENSEDYKSAEGSVDAQITDQLESSLEAWKQFGSDHDDDDDDDDDADDNGDDGGLYYGSDGAESSSPDASMADIIPMLDELHPLLEDDNPQISSLSRQSSASMAARSAKSHDSSIHSYDESDHKEDEVGDIKSDADDDDDEDETQGSKEDPEKSAITWTEDDQKNLMDLGSSEMERNQRLESLIARRRARRMMTEKNLIDLDGMDLQFYVAPISTTRRNPFDLPHDSYDDLGLPPIPGSAPSILLPRRNPFDLPYDSSEEKPDLTADSFQQEFIELYQGEACNQREPVFRRNETFNVGSSIFGFGRYEGRDTFRSSRFRPYFVPERTDSDVMSYSSSLQRQSSELSEYKASSAAETESTSVDGDDDDKKSDENESAQENEPSSEIDQASLLVELGSQSSDDLHSLLDKENDYVSHVPEIELGGLGNSPTAVSDSFETQSAEISLGDKENDPEAESWILDEKISAAVARESTEENRGASSTSSLLLKEYTHVDEGLVNGEQSQVDPVDMVVKHSLETSVSDVPSEHTLEAAAFNYGTEVGEVHPKEPVYDASPQVTRNNSSSSISSNIHMERSEIHLWKMQIVQRDLLMTEDPKVREEDAGQSVQHEKQDVDYPGITMNLNEVPKRHDFSYQSQFPIVSINSEASVLAECELQLSADFSNTGILKNESSDDKVSEDERMQVFYQEDNSGVYMESKLDSIEDEDEKASIVRDNYSEDLTLTPEERETSMLEYLVSPPHSELSSLTVELKEEARRDTEKDPQFFATSSNLMVHDNDMVEKLASALDESLHFPHESTLEDPSDSPEEQESSVIHSEVEEESNVDRQLNNVPVQECEESILPDPLQTYQHSFEVEKRESELAAGLVEKEYANNNIFQESSVSGGDEIRYDFSGDIKDMDEEVLSELDEVGEVSVKDVGPIMDISMTDSNTGFDSNMSEQVGGDNCLDTEPSFVHDTSCEADAHVQDVEPLTEARELNAAALEESNLDSRAGDASTGFLVLEAQSVEVIDAAFKGMSEEDVQKSIATESIGTDLTGELLEAGCPEPGNVSTEVVSPQGNVVNHSEPVEITASDGISVEGPKPDSNIVDSGLSILEAEISEKYDEDFEKTVESVTNLLNIGEAPQGSPEGETGVDRGEPTQLEINKDMKEIPEFSAVEAAIAPVTMSSAEVETFGFVESESFDTDIKIREIEDLFLAESSVASSADYEDPIESVSTESKSLLIERIGSVGSSVVEATRVTFTNNEDKIARVGSVESPAVVVGSVPSADNEDEIERDGSVGSSAEASVIPSADSEGETEQVGSSELCAFEPRASIIPSVSDEQIKEAGIVECGSLLIDLDIKDTQELPHDEETNEPAVDSEAQLDKVASAESQSLSIDGDVKQIQESPVEEMLSSFEAEVQTERFSLVESESVYSGGEVEDVQKLHDDETRNAPFVALERSGLVEVESFPVDRDAEAIQESPITLSGASENKIKIVGLVKSEVVLTEANIKGIEESPVVEAHIASAIESRDQTEGPSPTAIVASQVQQDHKIASLKQSDGLVSGADDSATLASGETSMEYGGTEKSSSQVEGESNESHLESSGSSASSSSSSSSSDFP